MSKLPKLDDFRAPWETEAGEDTEIDKPKLKKYIHGILSDKEKLQGSVSTLTTERDELKTAAEAKAQEGETEVQRLEREKKDLETKLAKKDSEPNIETLRLEVALEKGLTAVQAKRLLGKDKEELESDADALIESFGGTGKTEDGDDEGLRRVPRRVSNPGDPNGDKGDDPNAGKSVDDLFPVNHL